MNLTNKTEFTTGELARASWFPVNSTVNLRNFIRSGKIKAINKSKVEGKERFYITKAEVIRFIIEQEEIQREQEKMFDEIVKLHDSDGLSFDAISQKFGLTRQRIFQIYHSRKKGKKFDKVKK